MPQGKERGSQETGKQLGKIRDDKLALCDAPQRIGILLPVASLYLSASMRASNQVMVAESLSIGVN